MPEPWSLTHETYDLRLQPGVRSGCSGTFRVEDDSGRGPVITLCDGCGLRVGVARKVVEDGQVAMDRRALDGYQPTGEAF